MTVRWSPEMDAALVELRQAGLGYHTAGDRIGVAHLTAKRRTIELGLPTWDRGGGQRQRGKRATTV